MARSDSDDTAVLAGCAVAGCGTLLLVALLLLTLIGTVALIGWAWRLL